MKILFDHQIFELQKFGGISRYFFELLNHYSKTHTVQWELPIRYSDNEYLTALEKLSPVYPKPGDPFEQFLPNIAFKGKRKLYEYTKGFLKPNVDFSYAETNKQLVIEKLKKGDFDVFHPTYYDPYFLEFIGTKPYVLTVYDLIHEVFPEYSLGDTNLKNKELLANASKIIAISESTKRDLINILGIDENKIEITYLANSLKANSSAAEPNFTPPLPNKYILFVGNRSLYKNFYFFAQIFASIKNEFPDFEIVCTGSKFTDKEEIFLEKLGIKHRVKQYYVNDNELCRLYSKAHAFIYPSLYEGFGIPVLEAFSMLCPVLASSSSSLIEVGGDAAIYFDPKNAKSLSSALRLIMDDGLLRTTLIEKGQKQLAKFSWPKTASLTMEIYKSII